MKIPAEARAAIKTYDDRMLKAVLAVGRRELEKLAEYRKHLDSRECYAEATCTALEDELMSRQSGNLYQFVPKADSDAGGTDEQ